MIDKLFEQFSSLDKTSFHQEPSDTKIKANSINSKVFEFASTTTNIFSNQYEKTYKLRYEKLKYFYSQYLNQNKQSAIKDVYMLSVKNEEIVHIFGIINRKMRKFESFVQEVQRPAYLEYNYHRTHDYHNKEDLIFLEDISGKIELSQSSSNKTSKLNINHLNIYNLTTGCAVCLKGFLTDNNRFEVIEIILSENNDSIINGNTFDKNKLSLSNESTSGKNVLFLSSLKATEQKIKSSQYQGLANFLKSEVNLMADKTEILVTFGGQWGELEQVHQNLVFYYNHSKRFINAQENMIATGKYINEVYYQFLEANKNKSKRKVLIAPSLNDPTISSLPQIPFKKILFPRLAQNQRAIFLSNPDTIELSENVKILLMDGINVRDYQSQNGLDFYETAKFMLLMRLLAPTCPNTLEALPIETKDYLLLVDFTSLIVIGNSPDYKEDVLLSRKNEKICRIVFVPGFSESGKVVLMNFDTLQTKMIEFK